MRSAYSQTPAVNLNSISRINDISRNHILSIYKEKIGLVWYRTQNDLKRYDGLKFEVYKLFHFNSTSLPSNPILSINEGIEGNLWKRGLSLNIHIFPLFWKSWWFGMISAIIVIGVMYLVFWFKIRNVQKQKDELILLVNERTSQISKQTKDVEYLNQELKKHAEILQQQKDQEYNARLLAEEMKKEANMANCAKTTFLATMSHEMRTPMNGILGMAALLTDTKLNSEQLEYTKAIQQSGESLLNVINDVLDFSKIESRTIELQEHDFNLKKCIEDVFGLFEPISRNKGVIMRYKIDENISENLNGDSLHLRQILINLIGNAVKFTESGEITLNVSEDSQYPNDIKLLRLLVSDTGIGIPEKLHSTLFKAFHQSDSSITRERGGIGLGLVICHRLIKMLGGGI